MRHLGNFARFWYDFIVGDDWVIAAGAVAALFVTAWLVRLGLNAWWVMPVAVAALLTTSLRREVRRSK
jgi:hypothetical protein